MAAAAVAAVAVAVVAAAALGEGQSRKTQSVRPYSVPQSGPSPSPVLRLFPCSTFHIQPYLL